MFHFSPLIISLDKIINQHRPYQKVLFKVFADEKISKHDQKEVVSCITNILKNYFILDFALADTLDKYQSKSREAFLFLITLYLVRFRKCDVQEIYDNFLDAKLLLRLVASKEQFDEIIALAKQPSLLTDDIKKHPYLYNSLNLNIPEFLLRSFVADFGTEIAPKLALSLHSKTGAFYLPYQTDTISSNLFAKIRLSADEYIYKALDNKEVRQQVKNGKIDAIPLDYSYAYFLSKIDEYILGTKVLAFNQSTPFLSLYFAKKLSDYVGKIVPVFLTADSYRLALDIQKRFQVDNYSPLLARTELVKTYEPYEDFQIVLYEGRDTGIGKTSSAFSLLPSLEEKDFIVSYSTQLKGLLDASDFVKPDGVLLFYNHSLNSADSKRVTTSFLKEKNNFTVLKESFLFPFDHDSDGGYFCLMRRAY